MGAKQSLKPFLESLKALPRKLSEPLARLSAFLASDRLARVYDAMTVLWVFFFHRILAARFLRAPIGFDEHYFLHEGWSVAKGLVPYRDFQEFKPPVVFFVNALGLKLFGLDQMAYRHIFSILSLCGFLSLTVAFLSRRTNRLFVGMLLAVMMNHFFDPDFHNSSINSAETLSLDFFMLGCGILLLRTKRERLQQVVGAALLALSPLSKEPLVFATVLAWLTILLLHRAESTREDAAKQFARFTIAGAAGVALVWLVYMLVTHSLGPYVEQVKLNIKYSKNYAHQVNWFPRNPAEGLVSSYWKRLKLIYVNALQIGVFVPLFVAPLALWEGRRRAVGVAALATFAAALYAVTIGSGFAAHYFIMAMTGTFFCAFLGGLALDGYSKGAGLPMRHWVWASWLALAWITANPRFSAERAKYPDYKPQPPPVAAAEIDFVRAHSAPGDRIWTLGDPLLYVYSDRLSAFREEFVVDEVIDYYDGATDEQRLAGHRKGLEAQHPKLVVFGNDLTPYARKQRFLRALVVPFLKDGGYIKLNEKFYVRPW